MIKFPATLYGHYGSPLKLWLLARAWDAEDGCSCGRVFLSLDSAAKTLNRSIPTLRRWLREGKELGLFRHWRTQGDRLEIYYRSWFSLARSAGMENLGAIVWIDWQDLEHLELTATEAIAQQLQRESYHAAIANENKHEIKNGKLKIAPIGKIFPENPDEAIANSTLCQSGQGVLGVSGRFIFVSERFIPYGSSVAGIADRRHLSTRQIQRHLQSAYRHPSPVRGYHRKAGDLEKRQIAKRLPRRLNGMAADLRRGGEVNEANRLLKVGDRLFRLGCNLYAPDLSLCGVKRRRSAYKRFLSAKPGAPGLRGDKNSLLIRGDGENYEPVEIG